MRVRVLGYVTGVAALLGARSPAGLDPCPEGRTLEQRIEDADLVVLGEVTYDRDCQPPKIDAVDSGLVRLDCVGRRADLIIRRSWKGPASAGHGLALTMPAPGDSGGLLMRKGETRVVFATLSRRSKSPNWRGQTTACMMPQGMGASDSALVKELDRWRRSQKS